MACRPAFRVWQPIHWLWYTYRLVRENGRLIMTDNKRDKLIKVDMHCHTRLSKDSLNDPRKLVETAAARGLGALCVTDHNALANAFALSKIPDLPIMVIPSEEVKTAEGEIIGYFLSELVPKGLSPE